LARERLQRATTLHGRLPRLLKLSRCI